LRGDRKSGGRQGGLNLVFAIDRMGRGQQLAKGFAAQDIRAGRCVDAIGGIGLPAFELCDRQRADEPGDILFEPLRQAGFVEPVVAFGRNGSGKGGLCVQCRCHARSSPGYSNTMTERAE
jgi:hypothetical protein